MSKIPKYLNKDIVDNLEKTFKKIPCELTGGIPLNDRSQYIAFLMAKYDQYADEMIVNSGKTQQYRVEDEVFSRLKEKQVQYKGIVLSDFSQKIQGMFNAWFENEVLKSEKNQKLLEEILKNK